MSCYYFNSVNNGFADTVLVTPDSVWAGGRHNGLTSWPSPIVSFPFVVVKMEIRLEPQGPVSDSVAAQWLS
jgi:hypothetical protein